MKRSALTLAFLLPAVCAATAAAQVTFVRLAIPVNPIAGLPILLPSPMTGPLAGNGISLPALTPTLIPTLKLMPAPQAPWPAFMPLSLPGRNGQVPAPAEPSRDGVVNPLRRVMPGVVIRFSDAASKPPVKPVPAGPDADKQKLDGEFDGDVAPAKPAVSFPRRERRPVISDRRHGLPEDDLLRELGIGN